MRARRHFDAAEAWHVGLVTTGGLRRAEDVVKAMALGGPRRRRVRRGVAQLTRHLRALPEPIVVLARACGHSSVDEISVRDLTSWHRDVADLVGVAWAGVAR